MFFSVFIAPLLRSDYSKVKVQSVWTKLIWLDEHNLIFENSKNKKVETDYKMQNGLFQGFWFNEKLFDESPFLTWTFIIQLSHIVQ